MIALAAALDEHRRALEFDFWTRARIKLEDIGGSCSWSLAVSLFQGFAVEFGTHTHAAVSGLSFPVTYGGLAGGYIANILRSAFTQSEERFPMPEVSRPDPEKPVFTDADRAAAERLLDEYGAVVAGATDLGGD